MLALANETQEKVKLLDDVAAYLDKKSGVRRGAGGLAAALAKRDAAERDAVRWAIERAQKADELEAAVASLEARLRDASRRSA